MAVDFSKAESGKPLRIPASTYNAGLDAIKDHLARKGGMTTTPKREHPETSFWAQTVSYGGVYRRYLPKGDGQPYGEEFEVESPDSSLIRVAQVGNETDGTPRYRQIGGGDSGYLARVAETPNPTDYSHKFKIYRIDQSTGEPYDDDVTEGGVYCWAYLGANDGADVSLVDVLPRVVANRTNLWVYPNPTYDSVETEGRASCPYECRQTFILRRLCLV